MSNLSSYTLLVVATIVGGACSADAGAKCLLVDYPDVTPVCRDAQRVAARNTAGLRPAQAEVDATYRRIQLARTADDQLGSLHDRSIMAQDTVVVKPVLQTLIDVWQTGEVLTGNADVDSLLGELGVSAIEAETPEMFLITFDTPVHIDNTLTALRALDEVGELVYPGPGMDGGQILQIDSTTVRFVFAWGDCLVGCTLEHFWVVDVDDSAGVATVVDEGGDPLPPCDLETGCE